MGSVAPTTNRPTSIPPATARTPLDLVQLSVMVMAMVSVWRIQDLFPVLNAVKIQYIAPLLALLAFSIDSDARRSLRLIRNPLFYYLLAVGAMVVLSIPTSLWQFESFKFFYKDHSKTLLLLVLMAASIRSLVDLERYAMMHISGAVIYSYFVITHFRVSVRSGRLGDLIYYDSNDLALLLVCTIPFCVYFLRPKVNPLLRLAATAVLGLVAYTLVQTGSRGGFLGLLACGGYLLFRFNAVSKTIRMYAVGVVLAFMVTFGGDVYWEMMSSILHPTQDYNWTADSGRKEIWKRGIGYMLTHPITGVGASAFPQAEGTISDLAPRQAEGIGLKWSAAHNSFVQLGAELGVFGLGFFLAALWAAWRFVRDIGAPKRAERVGPLGPYGHALGGVLIAYAVAGFFLSAGYSSFIYTAFALVIGAMKVLATNQERAVVSLAPSSRRTPATGPSRPLGWGGLRRPAPMPQMKAAPIVARPFPPPTSPL